MLKRTVSMLLVCILMVSYAFAQTEHTILIRPGRTERIAFESGQAGEADITLHTADGRSVMLYHAFQVAEGVNYITWDGRDANQTPFAKGEYALGIAMQGEQVQVPVIVGEEGPQILSFTMQDAFVTVGEKWALEATVNMAGKLRISINMGGAMKPLVEADAKAGSNTLYWDGKFEGQALNEGAHMVALELVDETGFYSNPHYIGLNVRAKEKQTPAPQAAAEVNVSTQTKVEVPGQHEGAEQNENQAAEETEEGGAGDDIAQNGANVEPDDEPLTVDPSQGRPPKPDNVFLPPTTEAVPQNELGSSFWKLPVGQMDEDAIWKVMTQPMTVIRGIGKRDKTKEMYRLRAKPDPDTKNGNIIGEVTCESQGVHVLNTLDNGWSFVEVYNSSYGPDCKARPGWGNTDELLRGYVETDRLTQYTPRTDYGLLVDKLKQEMYIFKEGKLFSTLKISTGLPTKKQPWNETPAGEFAMVSKTGGFLSGNLYCDYGMRVNGGSLLHEVPYITNASNGYKDYSRQESQLGSKASHGCIRVQRAKNAEGVNMQWLWNNIKVGTKVLIWDDDHGRYHDYPDDTLKLYFNPKGGKFYHVDENCRSIKSRYLPLKGSFEYKDIDSADYKKLEPCTSCNPPVRPGIIDALNRKNGF